jgi:hypothetical protein
MAISEQFAHAGNTFYSIVTGLNMGRSVGPSGPNDAQHWALVSHGLTLGAARGERGLGGRGPLPSRRIRSRWKLERDSDKFGINRNRVCLRNKIGLLGKESPNV